MAANLLASGARYSAAKLCTQNSASSQRTKLVNVLAAPHRLFAAPLTSSSSAPHLRAFSVSASSAERVSSVVAEELKYEQDNYTKPELPDLPEGWSLTEVEGNSKVSLTREVGDEVVQVDFIAREYGNMTFDEDDEAEDEDEGDEEDDDYSDNSMTIEVAVMKEKADKALIFEAETDGEFVRILDVSLESVKDGEADDEDEETIYGGPVFTELDDKLQQAFVDYLEERGVNAELGRYILDYAEDKEQREYMKWLEGVKNFVEA
ncbi:g3970 [Coccomyxa elongata]